MDSAGLQAAHQPSLLQGFVASRQEHGPGGGVALASSLPVARVMVESTLPQLDRPFDYSVPAALDDQAQPGVRVRVPFGGQELNGYLIERLSVSPAERLVPLARVLSPVRVLTPEVLAVAEAVAARYAGSLSDVLRVAVPPRVAKLDKEYAGAAAQDGHTDAEPEEKTPARGTGSGLFAGYRSAAAFLAHVAGGGSPRAVLSALQGYGPDAWHHQLAAFVAACHNSGRGAVVVVPDLRDLAELEKAVLAVVPAAAVARLSADDGPTPRYRNFLALLSGQATIALGTRSAAFAPVRDPGLFCIWDDGDDLHLERRAPYQHAREVLLLRAARSSAAMVLAGHSRSTEAQRLLNSGWAQPLVPERTRARTVAARVVSTADSFEQERDPLAGLARLPQRAWETAKKALALGPVLVQVARAGYSPALACQRCRESARCTTCAGPLMEQPGRLGSAPVTSCRWCMAVVHDFSCPVCGGRDLRRTVTGATRTAEELGKAFPGVPVVSSSGSHVKATVADAPALVVATVGGEPLAPGGYAAALLLDGDSLLRRESLRASEDALRRWFNAAALVRPASEGGSVVLVSAAQEQAGYLVRWDPGAFAERELALRTELGLPPAVRIASFTGPEAAVALFTAELRLDSAVRVVGPALLESPGRPVEGESDVRTLLFFPYSRAAEVSARLRSVKAALAARRTTEPVQVRLDGVDVL